MPSFPIIMFTPEKVVALVLPVPSFVVATLPPSPVKNPFKRNKRRFWLWWLVASRFVLIIFGFVGLDFLAGTHLLVPEVEIPVESQTNTTKTSQQLDLRPAFLTDDGQTKEPADDGGEEESDDEGGDATLEQDDNKVAKKNKIPRTLIFTHYKNLLELIPSNPDFQNLTADELEEMTLAINVRHSIDIHKQNNKEVKVVFWTDKDCIASLERTRPKLVQYFKAETEGMYKADMCRGAALLEHGGFYLDADVGVRHDLWKDLKPRTQFVTARVHHRSNWVSRGFFQAILGAAPNCPVMERYLELFEKHYDGSHRIHKGPLGVLLLYQAWDDFYSNKISSPHDIPTELYQEFLFDSKSPLNTGKNKGILSPAPTWGKRRACHFVVAGFANEKENAEIRLGNKDLQIPVFSRIPGSRMCVAEENKSFNATRMIESMKWWERT